MGIKIIEQYPALIDYDITASGGNNGGNLFRQG